jgi:Mg2+/Co2+ transporter CorB
MTAEYLLTIAAIIVLLVISAFFSGSETALTAASRARIYQLEKTGNRRAILVAQLMQMRQRLIGALLLGNNLVNILASALATSIFLDLFGEAGIVYATLVMTALVLIFAEVLPKTWAIAFPERFALSVAPVVQLIVSLFGPVIRLIETFVAWLLRLFGVNVRPDQSFISPHEEIRGTVDLKHLEGDLVKVDRDQLGGILDLHDLEVSDVMVHRTNMQTLNGHEPSEKIIEQILSSPYTRLPIWRNEPQNIVGIVHAKDLLRALAGVNGDATALDVLQIASAPWFVPEATSLQNQLDAFLKRKNHFALAVDEYGEMMGLITLEDILEEIVGEIADEHDVEVQGVRPQSDGSIHVDGSVPVRDLNRAMEWDLPDEEATTIAGLVIHDARVIPDEKQAFTFHGFRFQVLKKQRNRITLLRIMPLARAI